MEAKDEVRVATRGDRYLGNIRSEPGQRWHSITRMWACAKLLIAERLGHVRDTMEGWNYHRSNAQIQRQRVWPFIVSFR